MVDPPAVSYRRQLLLAMGDETGLRRRYENRRCTDGSCFWHRRGGAGSPDPRRLSHRLAPSDTRSLCVTDT